MVGLNSGGFSCFQNDVLRIGKNDDIQKSGDFGNFKKSIERSSRQDERTPNEQRSTDPSYDIGTAVTGKNLPHLAHSKQSKRDNSGHI